LVANLGIPLPQLLTLGGSYWNDPGFPEHLASVQNFLLRKLGQSDGVLGIASDELQRKRPLNPFFNYMASKMAEARSLTATECPKQGQPSVGEPQEWSWECADVPKAARSSMYWDCIFMDDRLK
jgi:hypothetical protein